MRNQHGMGGSSKDTSKPPKTMGEFDHVLSCQQQALDAIKAGSCTLNTPNVLDITYKQVLFSFNRADSTFTPIGADELKETLKQAMENKEYPTKIPTILKHSCEVS